jgi:NAD(P)-dependent dehydrogenase (short-subunit alcohol dehydrogenase family)
VVAEFGAIDGLVACAGIVHIKPLLELTQDEWLRMIDVNLNGMFFSLQAAGAKMVNDRGGSIVLFSSVAGRSGRSLAAHYAAAKTGVLSLTKSAAAAFAPTVRVNAICPGVVLTDMWERNLEERAALDGEDAAREFLEKTLAASPLGRPGEPSEIASAAMFLLSNASSFITGQALNVDGGLEMD